MCGERHIQKRTATRRAKSVPGNVGRRALRVAPPPPSHHKARFPTQNFAVVKLLETVTSPPDSGISRRARVRDMTRRTGPSAKGRTGAAIMAAALLLAGEARAQSSGGGFLNFFDNIFTGSAPKAGPTTPSGPPPPPSA